MSKVLLDLKDYQITDTGEVLVKYDTLVTRIRCGDRIDGLIALPHEDIDLYNNRHPEQPITTGITNDEKENPPKYSFDFILPSYYADLDLDEYLCSRLVNLFLPEAIPEAYIDRLADELAMMRERNMEDFLCALIYICETFEKNNVVHGVGRGSACASLVLFLIGTHMVDPIKYEIPITEFLR